MMQTHDKVCTITINDPAIQKEGVNAQVDSICAEYGVTAVEKLFLELEDC